MSFLLVGDNRTNVNWGGRAGSLALHSLLAGALGAGRSVFASEMAPPGAGWRDRLRGDGDILRDDPAASVRNLLRRRRHDPALADLYDRVLAADTVVINGEGDVVFSRPVRRRIRYFAALVELARQLDKRIAWVNTILADCVRSGRDPLAFALTATALSHAHLVAVRDRESLRIAQRDMGLAGARLVPDALFHWHAGQKRARAQLPADGDFVVPAPEHERYLHRLDLAADYICVGGNSLVTEPAAGDDLVASYTRLCEGLRELGYPLYLVVADGRDRFLETVAARLDLAVVPVGTPIHFAAAILGKARLLVSGRYHPTIMAALGGTPCVFLATGSHKMRSLAETLEMPDEEIFPAAPDAKDILRLCGLASRRVNAGAPLRARIGAVAAQRAQETAELGRLLRLADQPVQARADAGHG